MSREVERALLSMIDYLKESEKADYDARTMSGGLEAEHVYAQMLLVEEWFWRIHLDNESSCPDELSERMDDLLEGVTDDMW